MSPLRLPALMFVLLLYGFADGDNSVWQLKKYTDGIAVYTRTHAGTSLREVRVVNTVNSSMSAIVALLMDIKNYPNWVFKCKEGQVLKEVNDHEQIHHQVTWLPFPMSNRDIITHFVVTQDTLTKIVTTKSTCEPNYIPVNDDCVRITDFQSSYKLTPLNGGKVQVEFELFVDPGGSIPKKLSKFHSNVFL